MKPEVIIIGIGEMGGVFARGFLKAGYPVIPVGRHDDIQALAQQYPNPQLVLVAVGEAALADTLTTIPSEWKSRLGLLQNELLPGNWLQHGLNEPTVISVWFEKKPGQDFKVLVASPVYGPQADIIASTLDALGIATQVLEDANTLLFELVRKNIYILTTNISGLECGGSVDDLRHKNAELMNRVFDDVMEIQYQLTKARFDRKQLMDAMLLAFDGDPNHQCMGRSAPQRLQRALEIAKQHGIEVNELQRIADTMAAN